MKALLKDFLKCGIAGILMEVVFTALNSLRRRDFTLQSTTSPLMFPIYGAAAFIKPLFKLMNGKNAFFRGAVYSILILTGEYLSGNFLKKRNCCPWSYSANSRWHVNDVIRIDYFFNWLFAGLFFERLLLHHDFANHSQKKCGK